MGSRMKDVQRKLDLSLEDLVEESKTNGGSGGGGGGRSGGRKRRRVGSREEREEKSDKAEKPEKKSDERASEKDEEKREKREEKGGRDFQALPRRSETDLAAGARKTGRPPASPRTAPAVAAVRPPGYPMPAWSYDPRQYPGYRPPMYLRPPAPAPQLAPAPVFRPQPHYVMPPAYPHPAPHPQLSRAPPPGPPGPPMAYPPSASWRAPGGHVLAPAPVAPAQASQPSRKRHRERHREPVESEPLPHGFQVRLSNIPQELTARDLAEAFSEVSSSRVESVDLLRDGAGRATGDAVIIFAARPDAQNAVRRYHGGDLNGKRLEAIYEGEVNVPKR